MSMNYNRDLVKQAMWQEIENELELIHVPSALMGAQNGNSHNVILFGCGIYGQIALQHFRESGIQVAFFCDNDPRKQGETVDGIKIIAAGEISSLDNPVIVITARHSVCEIAKMLCGFKCSFVSYDAYWVKTRVQKYRDVFMNQLDEKRSEEVYMGILKSMITGNHVFCQSVMENNAFWAMPNFQNTGNEVFVDAGAYVGDTVEQFIWQNIGSFNKIFAFEPGERQYNAMLTRVKRLEAEWAVEPGRIICVKAGLGEVDKSMPYAYNDASPLGSNFVSGSGAGDCEAKVLSLDSYMGEQTVTMIKADIEGFEMEMIMGAQRLIVRDRPKMALSIYHKPEDLFQILEFINTLVPEYKFTVRHHNYKLVDTVLYCWVE